MSPTNVWQRGGISGAGSSGAVVWAASGASPAPQGQAVEQLTVSVASPAFGGFFPPWLQITVAGAVLYIGWLLWQQRRGK